MQSHYRTTPSMHTSQLALTERRAPQFIMDTRTGNIGVTLACAEARYTDADAVFRHVPVQEYDVTTRFVIGVSANLFVLMCGLDVRADMRAAVAGLRARKRVRAASGHGAAGRAGLGATVSAGAYRRRKGLSQGEQAV
jgi:hypothetical protein